MIEELRITDLGVINEATIDLDPGFTVVTGETGAGKTMIVTGMALLLGERADPRAVRSGAERAKVEGRFRVSDEALTSRVAEAGGELDDAGPEAAELLVARHLTAAGRSRAYLGGAQVPAAVCAEVTSELITIHGQSEQVRLAAPDRQRELLDRFAGPSLAELLQRYRSLFAERRSSASELTALRDDALARAREIDLLTFGLSEIERVAPEPGEDVALAAEAERLQSADDLRLAATSAIAALAGSDDEAGGALTGVVLARKALEGASDPEVAELTGRLAEVSYALGDLAADLSRYLDRLDAEPGRLEWIAGRRAALQGLTRKYGASVDGVIGWSADAAARLARLESSDDRIEALTARVAALDRELTGLAEAISAARAAAAEEFSARVLGELAALAMPHARLVFALTPVELGPHGADHVDLLFSANPGSEPRSLAKVASGGELSRVRLALEVVLAADQGPRTLVFDEVDAGVGGRVAVEIGRRLAALAQHAQVVVVTHLAQVAAFADRHYVVVKADDGQVTTSGVLAVTEEERAAELARMMAGLETTDSALAHAGELVELAAGARRRS
ncbi:MAG: DNA repair protein RecN [Friedmanniella sp.]